MSNQLHPVPSGKAEETPRAWIFQSSPKILDMDKAIHLSELVWDCSSNFKKIRQGDRVYLWRAGKVDSGVVAVGHIVAAPMLANLLPIGGEQLSCYISESARERDSNDFSSWGALKKRVVMAVDRVFASSLPRHLVKEDPVLQHHQIVNTAQGAVFALNEEEQQALEQLLIAHKTDDTAVPQEEKPHNRTQRGATGGTLPPLPDLSYSFSHAWIFQANPKIFDVRGALTKLKRLTWTCPQYSNALHVGDRFYIWESGKEAGIVAQGLILSLPSIMLPFEEELPFYCQEDGQHTPALRVELDIQQVGKPLPKQLVKDNTLLARHRIVCAPMGTVFPLTPAEQQELDKLLAGERPEPVPVPADSYQAPSFAAIREFIQNSGQILDERTLRRYHLALQTRKFVILAGISGTGKTWLATNYAKAAGALYAVVPVAPNWTSNEDLLGYVSPLSGKYCSTVFCDVLRQAVDEAQRAAERGLTPRPCHIILDEMNLARVEYYFARFLSLMEERQRGEKALLELGPELTLPLPDNLYIIGTVNMDETTNGFADKVFDRAQLVELTVTREALASRLPAVSWADVLMDIWDQVHDVAPFAFRTLDEITAYMQAADKMGVVWTEALEECLLQKILPRLKGNDVRLSDIFDRLLTLTRVHDMKVAEERLENMRRQWQSYGFTSFFS